METADALPIQEDVEVDLFIDRSTQLELDGGLKLEVEPRSCICLTLCRPRTYHLPGCRSGCHKDTAARA